MKIEVTKKTQRYPVRDDDGDVVDVVELEIHSSDEGELDCTIRDMFGEKRVFGTKEEIKSKVLTARAIVKYLNELSEEKEHMHDQEV